MNNWICINFARNVQDNVARSFCYELAQMCQISGMVCSLPVGYVLPSLCTSTRFAAPI